MKDGTTSTDQALARRTRRRLRAKVSFRHPLRYLRLVTEQAVDGPTQRRDLADRRKVLPGEEGSFAQFKEYHAARRAIHRTPLSFESWKYLHRHGMVEASDRNWDAGEDMR